MTIFGLALPRESFITWPVNQFMAFSLPFCTALGDLVGRAGNDLMDHGFERAGVASACFEAFFYDDVGGSLAGLEHLVEDFLRLAAADLPVSRRRRRALRAPRVSRGSGYADVVVVHDAEKIVDDPIGDLFRRDGFVSGDGALEIRGERFVGGEHVGVVSAAAVVVQSGRASRAEARALVASRARSSSAVWTGRRSGSGK